MAKTKKEKVALKNEYVSELQKAKALVIVKPSKLTPNEANEFRKELYDFDAKFNIVKNTIFTLALAEANLPAIKELEKGEHAVLVLSEDIVSPSKSLKKFIENTTSKDGETKVEIVAGIMDGALLTKEQVSELADMPSFEGSISMILGILDNAMSGIVNVLEDPTRSFATILDQAFKQD
jgi:large subunit ribosomal protein L10